MAERIVSPGVFTRENDLSFLAQGVGQIGAAFIGPFKEGTAFVPTIVTSQSDLAEKFGTPDGTYYTEYAVQNYLREAGSATIIRVADVGGYTQVAPLGIFATSSVNAGNDKLIGVLYNTNATANIQEVGFTYQHGPIFLADASGSGAFTLSGSVFGATTIAASINPSDVNDLSDVFGETPIVPSTGKKAYTYIFFENSGSLLSAAAASSSIYVKALEDQDYSQGDLSVNGTTDAYSAAFTPWVKSQNISNERYDLFRFVSLGHGEVYNTKFKVGISNVKAAGEDGSTDYSTFTVTIRSFSDTDRRKVVLETFNNVNLDPASPNYIARRIGDRYFTISSDGKINEFGDYTPRSKYVRVQVKEQGSFPVSAAPFGHGSYYNPIKLATADESKLPAVVFTTGSAGNTSSSPTYYSGFDFETTRISTDNKQYLKPLPNGVDVGANVVFSFDSQLSYQMTGSNSADMAKRQFVLGFQGGFAGSNPIVKKAKAGDSEWGVSNTQGFNCTTSTSSGSLSYIRAINAISNADEYDINMVVTPGIVRSLHPSVTTAVIDMVEDRADAFYIADFNDYDDTITEATEQANLVDTNYAATYYPWVKTIDSNTNKLLSVPPSVLMPAVFASNDAIAAEWFAPAGLNRGGIIGAVSVLNRLTHSERDTLYENKVNPIAAFPGQGIVAFGQKTLQDRASALDRINVRRLLITVKKFVASTSRFLVFEQNTASTRARFINTVTPYLEAIQQRQGLFAFRVVMDESNNTPDVIDRNILAGQLFLQPTRTAEFIVIDFNILPTGASFNA